MGPYVADFVSLRHKVIIELDGSVHEGRESYDQNRDRWLRSQGFAVIRIKNEELEKNRMEVLLKLRRILLNRIGFK